MHAFTVSSFLTYQLGHSIEQTATLTECALSQGAVVAIRSCMAVARYR
jgi:hypothetical protein